MKTIFKSLLVALAMLAGVSMNAQNKGEMYVGGGLTLSAGSLSTTISVNGTSETETAPTATKFTITPSFGYFVADNVRLGVSLNYGLEADAGSSTSSLLIGPEVAYYVRLADKFYYTPELGLYGGLGVTSTGSESSKISTSMGAFGLALNVGQFEFRPTSRLALSTNLMGLQYVNMFKVVEKATYSAGSFNFNISANIAVRYYF